MKYFTNCRTLEELKKEYRRLTFLHHPDRGGDTATMAAINSEYDEVFPRLKDQHNAAADEYHKTTEAPEEFRNICEVLLHMDGLTIELCGSWLWISGDTKTHKDGLKAAGCKWASKKLMWYWHHEEDGARHSRGKRTMEQIRQKYGSEIITGTAAASNRIGATA